FPPLYGSDMLVVRMKRGVYRKTQQTEGCLCRAKFDPPCRSTSDPGAGAMDGVNQDGTSCCLTKKCYPTDGCRSCWFPRRAEETASAFAALGRGGWGLPQ